MDRHPLHPAPITADRAAALLNDCAADLRGTLTAKLHTTETVFEINGGFSLPVTIEYDAAPAEPVNDYPGYVDIVHVKANGLDIRGALPAELLAALAQDIRGGGL